MKYLKFLTILTLIFVSLGFTALGYDEHKPQSTQVVKVMGGTKPKGTPHDKGAFAETAVSRLFTEGGYFECPAKYYAFGNPNAVGMVYPHEENGIDGLFIKLARKGDRKNGTPYIADVIVHESKYQAQGGSPKLGKMGCFTCSGGPSTDVYEKTGQMSQRWIHNAAEWAARKGASACDDQQAKKQCAVICPLLLNFLAGGGVSSITRTASVMSADGTLTLYALHDTETERRAGKKVLGNLVKNQPQENLQFPKLKTQKKEKSSKRKTQRRRK